MYGCGSRGVRKGPGGTLEWPGDTVLPLYWHWLDPGNTNVRVAGWEGGWVVPTRYTHPPSTQPVPPMPVHPADGRTSSNSRFEVDQGDPRGVKRSRYSGPACAVSALRTATLRTCSWTLPWRLVASVYLSFKYISVYLSFRYISG